MKKETNENKPDLMSLLINTTPFPVNTQFEPSLTTTTTTTNHTYAAAPAVFNVCVFNLLKLLNKLTQNAIPTDASAMASAVLMPAM